MILKLVPQSTLCISNQHSWKVVRLWFGQRTFCILAGEGGGYCDALGHRVKRATAASICDRCKPHSNGQSCEDFRNIIASVLRPAACCTCKGTSSSGAEIALVYII